MKKGGYILVGLIVLAIIANVIKGPSGPSLEELRKEAVKVQPEAKKPNNADAYGMCCQAIQKGYPSAENFKMSAKECVDYGNGIWMIVGYADIMERRVRWAAEIQRHADDTWQLTGAPAFVNVNGGQ
jgi:hypothetical protein